jgi:hypothetical protein
MVYLRPLLCRPPEPSLYDCCSALEALVHFLSDGVYFPRWTALRPSLKPFYRIKLAD